jgi:holin (3TMs family)
MGVVSGIVASTGAVDALGRAARGVAEVFLPNATDGQRLGAEAQKAALEQLGGEFALDRRGLFDRFVDGLNRLPRPMLAMGTLGLFVYAMVDPLGFAARMGGLAYVPDPLWWLLGAIVGFYFGAREMHYLRAPATVPIPVRPEPVQSAWIAGEDDDSANSALSDWQADRD